MVIDQVHAKDNSDEVNFSAEVDKLLETLTYNNSQTRLLFDTVNENFKKHQQTFLSLANRILAKDQKAADRVQDLLTVPEMEVSSADFIVVTAMQIQNAFHQKNSARVDAI